MDNRPVSYGVRYTVPMQSIRTSQHGTFHPSARYQRQVRTLSQRGTIRRSRTKSMELRQSPVSHGKTGGWRDRGATLYPGRGATPSARTSAALAPRVAPWPRAGRGYGQPRRCARGGGYGRGGRPHGRSMMGGRCLTPSRSAGAQTSPVVDSRPRPCYTTAVESVSGEARVMCDSSVPRRDAARPMADVPGCVAAMKVLKTLPTQACRGRGAPA